MPGCWCVRVKPRVCPDSAGLLAQMYWSIEITTEPLQFWRGSYGAFRLLLVRGSHFQNTAAAAKPTPPMTTMPAPSDMVAAVADISTGPPHVPTSVIKRQIPRN